MTEPLPAERSGHPNSCAPETGADPQPVYFGVARTAVAGEASAGRVVVVAAMVVVGASVVVVVPPSAMTVILTFW